MVEKSRRTFLQHASAAAAATGLAAAVPALTATSASASQKSSGRAHEGAFVVYVRDQHSGDIAVMVGEREVVHHDPQLAAQLARLAGATQER